MLRSKHEQQPQVAVATNIIWYKFQLPICGLVKLQLPICGLVKLQLPVCGLVNILRLKNV